MYLCVCVLRCWGQDSLLTWAMPLTMSFSGHKRTSVPVPVSGIGHDGYQWPCGPGLCVLWEGIDGAGRWWRRSRCKHGESWQRGEKKSIYLSMLLLHGLGSGWLSLAAHRRFWAISDPTTTPVTKVTPASSHFLKLSCDFLSSAAASFPKISANRSCRDKTREQIESKSEWIYWEMFSHLLEIWALGCFGEVLHWTVLRSMTSCSHRHVKSCTGSSNVKSAVENKSRCGSVIR